MMMPSKMRLLATMLFCAVGGSLFASAPADLFLAHREAILSGACKEVEGVTFGVGQASARSESAPGREAAWAKADLGARANLVARKALAGMTWQGDLTPEARRSLEAVVESELEVKATVRGALPVFREELPEACRVVVACEAKGLASVPKATPEQVRAILLNPQVLKRHFRQHGEALIAYVRAQRPLPESLRGTDWRTWSEAQLNLFCGIPASVPKATPILPAQTQGEGALPKVARPYDPNAPYIRENINDTIGF